MRDLHRIANRVEYLGMATVSGRFVSLRSRFQSFQACFDFADLGRDCVLKRWPQILHDTHAHHC
jgi:aryl carrier-like protein